MGTFWPSVFNVTAAAASFGLGFLVLARAPEKPSHRSFAILTLNLALWACGVFFIVNSYDITETLYWARLTFCVAAFLPATFYYFIALFPNDRFEGNRGVAAYFCVSAVVLCFASFTEWHITSIKLSPGMAPTTDPGPVMDYYALNIILVTFFAYKNLSAKLRTAEGVRRRQIQHVFLGIFGPMWLAILTNVMAPIFKIASLQPYGPSFTALMMVIFAYAMVRYRLLDVWVIVSRTTVYALTTAFVAMVFLAAISLIHWSVSGGGRVTDALPMLAGAALVALVLQPLKEKSQLFLDRLLVHRRYDPQAFLERVSRLAAEITRMDELLKAVCEDIQRTLGVPIVRVLLIDPEDETRLIIAYSTAPDDTLGAIIPGRAALITHARYHGGPILLEMLQRGGGSSRSERLIGDLQALGTRMCVPMRAKTGLVGLLALGPKASRDMYTRGDEGVLKTLAGPLATSIVNARLYAALEEANLHRALVLANMRGGVIAVDADGRLQTTNETAEHMLGRLPAGAPLDALPERVGAILRAVLTEKRVIQDVETSFTRPDGEEIHVAMSASCLLTHEGGVMGAMVLIYDLTQIKRLEQNVLRADRLSSIGTLASGMAHEIKNPLVSIKTFSQLLLQRYDDPDFRMTFSEIIPQEVERIDSIVGRLLDFARPKSPSFQFHDVRSIIEEVAVLLTSQTRKFEITVELDFPDFPLEIYADEQQMHQVFLNLGLNAIHAMRHAPVRILRIRAEQSAMPHGHGGGVFAERDCVKVTVSDTGCGFTPKQIEQLFTPFYTTKPDGTGLGLAVVHGILEEHGAEIHVTGKPGQGATFEVYLPVKAYAAVTGEMRS